MYIVYLFLCRTVSFVFRRSASRRRDLFAKEETMREITNLEKVRITTEINNFSRSFSFIYCKSSGCQKLTVAQEDRLLRRAIRRSSKLHTSVIVKLLTEIRNAFFDCIKVVASTCVNLPSIGCVQNLCKKIQRIL